MNRPPADAPTTIYLIGMMGSGKSTLGRALAHKLDRQFVDLDERVEGRAGVSIPDIFQRYGESRFRDLEAAALAEVSRESGLVVALGGGTPMRAANRERLRETGCVVHLRARPETLAARLPDDDERPLLGEADAPDATLATLLAEREPHYNEIADITLDNDEDVSDALSRLIDRLGRQGWLSR